ncbi:MAG: Rrf2 family transcriptional regulator [Planctomycetota bacterium]|nr:MAG: Rrf2 family transcriptional regulator [Planctomycetota bacterium]
MILSRSADYGLRALIYLAEQASKTPTPLDVIAREQQVPPALLSKILQTLVKGKVLRSHKGYGGGFVLVADPAQLSVARVIELIDGPFTVFECLTDDGFCKIRGCCKLRAKFGELQALVRKRLGSITIAELVDDPAEVGG